MVIVISTGLLAREEELRLAVPLLIGCTASSVMLLAYAAYCGDKWCAGWSPATILGVAALLRLMFLFSPPQLSDDIYRYLWDGANLSGGTNPYAYAPASVTPPPELHAIHGRINHPRYTTIYPPAAQVIFAGGASLAGNITGLKTLLLIIDLLLCRLVLVLLKRLEIPAWRAVLYAWNPLPVLEIAGSGHVDGTGMTLLIGALLCLLPANAARPRNGMIALSALLLACAALVKLFPLALIPLFFLLVPRKERLLFGVALLMSLAGLTVPFLPHLKNMFASLDVYARNWEFAGFVFTILRSLTGSGAVARLAVSALLLSIISVMFMRLRRLAGQEYLLTAKARLVLSGCYSTATAFLMLTPTLQPWYALSLAVFLPFCAGPVGLVLCWAVFLTYQVQIPYYILGTWLENPYVTGAVFLAPAAAFLLSRTIRTATPKYSSMLSGQK